MYSTEIDGIVCRSFYLWPNRQKSRYFALSGWLQERMKVVLGSVVVTDHFVQVPYVIPKTYEESTRSSIFISDDYNVYGWMP